MRFFDHDYVNEVLRRIKAIAPDRRPRWGRMTPAQMVAHLGDTIRYSMGRAGEVPDRSSWFSRRIVAPLILNGIVPIPHNLPAPEYPIPLKQCDIETFHAILETYLAAVSADEFAPAPHPFFGALGVDGWAKMHVAHFEHHLRQFGA